MSDITGGHSAGDVIDDLCRVCKIEREHRVIAVDGTRLRVACGYCGSQHNYRGGSRPARPASPRAAVAPASGPLVAERERSQPAMSADGTDLEMLLRRIIREEVGLTPVAPAKRWNGGEMVLRPGDSSLQEKSWPIETFFHKIVMVRNRLRALEQQINGADIPQQLKIKLQGYITGCYGTLTSFNVLFADDADRFTGAGS